LRKLRFELNDMETRRSFLDYPENERFAYFALLAAIAGADGTLDAQERLRIQELCQQARMSPEHTARALAIAQGTTEYDFNLAFDTLRDSDLRFLAVADMLFIARSDGKITDDETREIEGFCQSLDLNAVQIRTLRKYVDQIIAAKNRGADENLLQDLTDDFKNELILAQVPTSLFGYSAGVMAGIGVVGTIVGTAAGVIALPFALSYEGVRALWKKWRARA
jgi:tellurite resistance protein